MAAQANPVATISPAEMQILVSRAGLVLNPGQVADLVLAWRQVAGLIASLPHDRPMVDDLAYAFRLPPPVAPSRPTVQTASQKPAAPARKPATPARKPAAKRAAPKPKPKPKRASTRSAAKPKARRSAKRGR